MARWSQDVVPRLPALEAQFQRVMMNFFEDWIEHLRSLLRRAGYDAPEGDDGETIEAKYFNAIRRALPVRRWMVVVAPSLVCPPELEAGLAELRAKAEAGDDLNPHLSRALLRSDFHDGLLNDWGLHHFHLGSVREADGFIERTGPALFVRANGDTLYFVDIRQHGAWADADLLEIVLAHWPELLEPYRLKGISLPQSGKWTAHERMRLRRAGAQCVISLSDGKAYMSPGGGITSSQLGVQVVLCIDSARRQLWNFEAMARTRIAERFETTGEAPHGDWKLGIRPDWSVYVECLRTETTIELGAFR